MLFIKKEYKRYIKNVQMENVNNFSKYVDDHSLSFQLQFYHSRSCTIFEYNSLNELEEDILKLEYIIKNYTKGVYTLDEIIIPN